MPPAAGLKMTVPLLLLLATLAAIILSCLATGIWALVRIALGLPLLPRVKPRMVPWGLWSVVLLFVFYMGLASLVGGLSRYVLHVGALPKGAKAPVGSRLEQIMLLNALLSASMILIIPHLLRLASGARRSDLGLDSDHLGWNVLRGVIATFLLAPLVYFVNISASLIWKPNQHPVMDMIRHNQSLEVILIAYGMAVVIAPVFEEMLFRGVLLAWLWKLALRPAPDPELDSGVVGWSEGYGQIGGPVTDPFNPGFTGDSAAPTVAVAKEQAPSLARLWMPNILTSILFGAAHYQQWPAPVPIFLLSLGLGYVYQRTGRLAAPIALHATFNGLSTTLMFLAVYSKLPFPEPAPKPAAGVLRIMNERELGARRAIRYSSLPLHDVIDTRSGIAATSPDRAARTSRSEVRAFSSGRGRIRPMSGGHEPTDRGSSPGDGLRESP